MGEKNVQAAVGTQKAVEVSLEQFLGDLKDKLVREGEECGFGERDPRR
jgi:hypothetical protein